MSSADCDRVFEAVAAERREIAALVESLDAGQLATPSLCAAGMSKLLQHTWSVTLLTDFGASWPAVYDIAAEIAGLMPSPDAAQWHLRPTSRTLFAVVPIIGLAHRSPVR
ncbi:hypothetical protein [Mycolicibacterium grossiae]|jgi:hypothetical protein|uniref:hypothetical protein n=1 Tax=Mycolicibacterium grossiae TaxID=1552759 RepID=UPI00210CFE22|nr:hypothetical protein [Mycolicibacterium grossiae]